MKKQKVLILFLSIIAVAGIFYFALSDSDQIIIGTETRTIPPGTPGKIRKYMHNLDASRAANRALAAKDLGKQGDMAVNAIPFLIDMLDDFASVDSSYQDGQIVMKLSTTPANEAFIALAMIDIDWSESEDAKEAMLGYVNSLRDSSNSWRVRKNAAMALGLIKDPHSARPLSESFSNKLEVMEVRRECANSLMLIGGDLAVSAFVDMIKSDEEEFRLFSAEKLVALGGISTEPLISLLSEASSRVKVSAITGLRKLRNPLAIKPLIQSFDDSDQNVIVNLVNAFEVFGDRAIPALLKALRSRNANIRKGASKAIWRLGWRPKNNKERSTFFVAAKNWKELIKIGKPAIKPLVTLLKDDSTEIRKKSAQTLTELNWWPSTSDEKVAYFLAAGKWDKLVEVGKPAIKSLIAALSDETYGVRENAVHALGKIGDPRALEPLKKMLGDKHAYIRASTVDALFNIGGDEVIEPIITCLYDDNVDVCVKAVGALGKIGSKLAIEPLIGALHDEEEQVQVASRAALKKIGPRAYEQLANASFNKDWFIRKTALELLSLLKVNRAKTKKILITALKDDDWIVRKTAAHALKEKSWEAKDQAEYIIYLIAMLDFEKLVEFGRPAVEPLINILYERNLGTRTSVIWALTEIRDKRAVQPLIGMLTDESSKTREDVTIALGKFGDLRAVDPLIKLSRDEKNLNVKDAVMDALKALLGEDYEDALDKEQKEE